MELALKIVFALVVAGLCGWRLYGATHAPVLAPPPRIEARP